MDLEQSTRNSFFGKYVNKAQRGIEIGPSYRPTFAKKDGWNVVSMDHCSTEDLISKYRDEKIDEKFISNIEYVDYVWKGQTYENLFSGQRDFNYIVASHVIEHAPDLLSFLVETSNLLTGGGYLLLAVPDKKATFDFYRPNTTIGDVIVGHLSPELYDLKALLDESHLRCDLDGAIAWNREASINNLRNHNIPSPSYEIKEVESLLKRTLKEGVVENKEYRDAHRWVFTPETLQDLIGLLSDAGLIKYEVIDWTHTGYYEFLMVLQKKKECSSIPNSRFLALSELVPNFERSDNSPKYVHAGPLFLIRKSRYLKRILRAAKSLKNSLFN
jgi:hypothetical protein